MMFSITEHIEYLMTRHDCVAIPGWGAFIANYNIARYDEEREVMEHPCRTLGFNAGVDHNDGLLVNSIMRSASVDLPWSMWAIMLKFRILSFCGIESLIVCFLTSANIEILRHFLNRWATKPEKITIFS